MKRLIVFDLDGTLAESKAPLDAEMAALLGRMLALVKVAIISGGAWPQFDKQVLPNLADDDHLRNLSLLPTCGTKFYRRDETWKLLYSEDFTAEEKSKIIAALGEALDQSGLRPDKQWGEIIEDRGGQVTLSALGQEAPLEEKKAWDPKFEKRKKIKAILAPMIPEFSIQLGGSTSIDITRPGVDKAYGIRKLKEVLGVPIGDMIFIGDALFAGGNDYPAKEAGALSIQVRDPHETKRVVEAIIACLEP
jgi:phosphomannomutase